ncbi:MAG: alpha-amylase/4-alpha-glucanotransferase domain-containing protein [Thermoguttaceae bacterium]
MQNQLRLIFALHNHQPIGNFRGVMEQSYRDSYLPFLDVFEQFPQVKLTLHTSGSLIEFLAEDHPEYLDRIAQLVAQGRIEIVGGPFFEPILAMLPSRDRIGQITTYTQWLNRRLGAEVAGLWIPERVWEQNYVNDLACAGMRYAILDDAHFRSAGVDAEKLFRHYITEDNGKTLAVFPGSERLRYLIPFGKLDDTMRYLADYAERFPNAVIVHGDDGEKFGSWPDTFSHVFRDKWLANFFTALTENADWLVTTTPSEVLQTLSPLGKIYLPDGSYREMTEWALQPKQRRELDELAASFSGGGDARWSQLRPLIRGGFWRNFKVRYNETDEMYCRMMTVSRHLQQAEESCVADERIDAARMSLYRGQCNCSYWHGAFGGVYLPHLRNAVYHELITADAILDAVDGRVAPWIEATAGDFLCDGLPAVRLRNETLDAWFAPHRGGTLYELDVKPIAHNLLATLTRREEIYHQKLRDGATLNEYGKPLCKTDGLAELLQYDTYRRVGLVDLFYDVDTTLDRIVRGQCGQHGDFVSGEYEATIRKNPDRIQVVMVRDGVAYGAPIRVTKGVTMCAGSNEILIAYRIEKIPPHYRMHFAVELNFAGMPSGLDDRYFYDNSCTHLGHLGTPLDIVNAETLGLRDEWLKLDVSCHASRPTNFYAFPIETVSQSEGGVEHVHQSVAVQPHWWIEPDANGAWSVEMRLVIATP